MEAEGLEVVHLELKYCELCGGLWLRLQGTAQVLCEACRNEKTDFPVVRRKPGRPRLLVQTTRAIDGVGGRRLLVCEQGGNT